jgi:hypothetical protein
MLNYQRLSTSDNQTEDLQQSRNATNNPPATRRAADLSELPAEGTKALNSEIGSTFI